MMYVVDETVLEADTPEELVSQMHNISLAQAKDDFEWMENTSKTTFQTTGMTIRWGTAADFVADMMKAGIIQETNK